MAKDDFVPKNENFSIIDIYCDDYFRAIEFLYSLNKNILSRLDSDNQTKNEINKEEENIYQYNLNNKTNKLANPRSSLLLLDENNIINNKKNNKENINNNINKDGQNKHMNEKADQLNTIFDVIGSPDEESMGFVTDPNAVLYLKSLSQKKD